MGAKKGGAVTSSTCNARCKGNPSSQGDAVNQRHITGAKRGGAVTSSTCMRGARGIHPVRVTLVLSVT
jgi:hypothetical protein